MLATLYVACADPPKKSNKGGAGTGGDIEEAGASASENGGSNATSGKGGTSGGPVAEGGKGEIPEGMGGEAGMGEGGEGGEGGAPFDICNTLTIGGPSGLPVAPTTGVAQPAGNVGGLSVINWAGFKGAITYTFDDNLTSQVTHYAELHAVGVPMTFYLVANHGANPVWAKAFKDGHELGNHTMHHCYNSTGASNCTWSAGLFSGADAEIDDLTANLISTFKLPGVYTMAAPFGDKNWEIPASKRFIVNRGVVDDQAGFLPNTEKSPMAIPCHITNAGETAAQLNTIVDDVRVKGSWRTVLAHNVDPAIIDYGYNPVQLADIVGTMTYAKSVGDVWADTMVAIGSYWVAQKALTDVQPKTVGKDKVYSWTLPDFFPPGRYVRIKVTGGKVTQCGTELAWDDHGYYEINLDAGSVTISPP